MYEVISPSDASPLGSLKVYAGTSSDMGLQRAEGSGRVVLSGFEKKTRLKELFQRSPIRVMFPRTSSGAIEEAVLVNTAGGLAGGDKLQFEVIALANASVAVTSQAAEKVYRALREPAQVVTKLKAGEAAKLAWLPQETIIFNRARLVREMEIELSTGAELLALEWLVLGRAAHGEQIAAGHIQDSWRVKKDGRLLWADSFRASDEAIPHLYKKALVSSCKALATLIYFGPDIGTRLDLLRDTAASLQCHCGATSVGGLIVARFAAEISSDLRLALRSFLQGFSRVLGGSPFGVPKMWWC
jgi:urease accessory protein